MQGITVPDLIQQIGEQAIELRAMKNSTAGLQAQLAAARAELEQLAGINATAGPPPDLAETLPGGTG